MNKSRKSEAESMVDKQFQSLRDLKIPEPSPEAVEEVVDLAVAAFKEGRANEGKNVH